MPYGSKYVQRMMNGARLLAMCQAYALVESCRVTGIDQSAGIPGHITA